MSPTFYADNFRRYNVFLKDYPGNALFRVACGPSDDDYDWTKTVMAIAGKRMDGLALHYYTLKGSWTDKGSATEFDEADWKATLAKASRMEELVARHEAIMDHYDPERKVALVVDEWGNWFDPTPGSNPGFLVQQNTMRDAVSAALTLHIFQRHAGRVRMANIAQMVNVLQAMIMTDGPRMVVTPTYHAFEMLSVHQGATSLPTEVAGPDYVGGPERVAQVDASASRGRDGLIHVSLVNTDPAHAARVTCRLPASLPRSATGRVLTASAMQACNTLASPGAVAPAALGGVTVSGDSVTATLPSKSVAVLEITP
jgi:alpha-N-arabinofuranosidase